MNKGAKRILFVQIEHFHGEVLGPQLELLEDEYDLYLFASPGLIKDDLISVYNVKSYSTSTFDLPGLPVFIRKAISVIFYIINLLKLKLLSKKIRADLIVFNTIPDILKVRLIGWIFTGIKKILIVHNADKYLQKNILFKYFEKILFLSEEVYNYCSSLTNIVYRNKLSYFIPIYFTKYLNSIDLDPIATSDERVVIGIIGKTDTTKRDYSGLLETLVKYKDSDLKFSILISGEVLKSFVIEIEKYELESFIMYRQGYQPFSSLFTDIMKSDLLLFLINRKVKFFDKYNKVKISGTTNMAKAFCKPVAYSEDFGTGKYLKESGIIYKELDNLLDKIQTGEITKDSIKKSIDVQKCIEYKEIQAEQYKQMIKSIFITL